MPSGMRWENIGACRIMAPPSKLARLSHVSASALAEQVQLAVENHMAVEDPPNVTASVIHLCLRACQQPPADFNAVEYGIHLAAVVRFVFCSPFRVEWPASELEFDPQSLPKGEWRSELLLVMKAANARLAIHEGKRVSISDLAVVASLSTMQVRADMRAKKLKAAKNKSDEYEAKAKDALEWLRGRGLA